MDYVYGIVWLVVAVILIFKMSKEDKIFIFLGAFFVVMGIWWLADAYLTEVDLLNGDYGLILRGIGAVVLAITVVYYYKKIYSKREK